MLPFLALAAWFDTRTRIFFRAFLIGHALVHVMYLVPEPPADQTSLEWSFHLDRSWVFSALGLTSQTVRIVGAVLVVVAVVGFIATGDGPPRGRSEAGFSESKQAPRGWRNAVRSYRPRLPASAHQ
jgi:hypothetical protein